MYPKPNAFSQLKRNPIFWESGNSLPIKSVKFIKHYGFVCKGGLN